MKLCGILTGKDGSQINSGKIMENHDHRFYLAIFFSLPNSGKNWYTFRSLTAGFTKKLLSQRIGSNRAPTIIFSVASCYTSRTAPRRLERSAKEHNGEKLGGKLDSQPKNDGKSFWLTINMSHFSWEIVKQHRISRCRSWLYNICIVLYLYTMILFHSRDLTLTLCPELTDGKT